MVWYVSEHPELKFLLSVCVPISICILYFNAELLLLSNNIRSMCCYRGVILFMRRENVVLETVQHLNKDIHS